MNFNFKKYIGEDDRNNLTKNKIYKIDYENDDEVLTYDNEGYIEWLQKDKFEDFSNEEYKRFIIKETQEKYQDCLRKIKEADKFINDNDPYYTFYSIDVKTEYKLDQVRGELQKYKLLQIYYEMLLKYFGDE